MAEGADFEVKEPEGTEEGAVAVTGVDGGAVAEGVAVGVGAVAPNPGKPRPPDSADMTWGIADITEFMRSGFCMSWLTA